MSLTFFGWLFVGVAIPIVLHFLIGTRGLRKEQPDLENYRTSLEEIGARLKNGELTDAEADAARLALLSRLPSPRWGFNKNNLGRLQKLLVASVAFLLVSGIGAAVSYDRSTPETMGSQETIAFSGPDSEMLARLADYVRSIGSEQPSALAATGEPLPDVNAMIERLAARLESTPQDIEGWRMLGWSYFHTERYEQAATAFERALKLDPGSAELKLSYEEAKAKASDGRNLETTPPSQTGAAVSDVMSGREQDAAIRSMVDGLAQRLKGSPRDVDGWIHLMRLRIVLGETEVAAAEFRKALAVFVEDPAASEKIMAAALGLGLRAE
jgi:cytochrome c-type biogenesis protein CcmH/NrfG